MGNCYTNTSSPYEISTPRSPQKRNNPMYEDYQIPIPSTGSLHIDLYHQKVGTNRILSDRIAEISTCMNTLTYFHIIIGGWSSKIDDVGLVSLAA